MEAESELLERCFSQPDLEFAVLPEQIDSALVWIKHLIDRQARWKDVRHQIEDYLARNGVRGGPAKRQMERAKALMRPWLV